MAFFSDLLKKWFYTNSSSAASSDARIPLLNANGTPKGSDTMANIASVLGVNIPKNLGVIGSAKRDEISEISYTAYLYSEHAPLATEGFLMTIGKDHLTNGANIQYFTPYTGDYVVTRVYNWSSNAWTNWKEVSLDIPSFYKNYGTLSALASALEVTMSRRTRLEDFDLATLKQAIADQNLEKYGLKVGDQKTINGHTYVIAGLNPMKGTSTPYRINQNHVGLIVIPHTTHAWNVSGNTYEGAGGRGAGYKNSDLHAYLKDTILPMCQSDLGSANLISHYKMLSNAVNTSGINRFGNAGGCSSSCDWEADCFISALSEVQVYGGTVWSSSGYDTGETCRQLEVFQKYSHTEIFGGEYPWLRDVVSASYAAFASYAGLADRTTASNACFVAALILFK